MFSAGLFGTFAHDSAARWLWFAVSILGYLVVIHQVGLHGSKAAGNKDGQTRRFYRSLVGLGLFVTLLYPMYVELVLSS